MPQRRRDLMPGIFDKWPLIKKVGAEEVAVERLAFIARRDLIPNFVHLSESNLIIKTQETILRSILDDATHTFWDPASQLAIRNPKSAAVAWEIILARHAELRRQAIDAILKLERDRILLRIRHMQNLAAINELQGLVREYVRTLDRMSKR